MSAKQAKKTNPADILKWIVGLLIAIAAVGGNVYLESRLSAPVRAAGVIVLMVVALLTLKTTHSGGVAWRFVKDSRMEMRKVGLPHLLQLPRRMCCYAAPHKQQTSLQT